MKALGFVIGVAGALMMLMFFDVGNTPLWGFLLFVLGLFMMYFGSKRRENHD